MQTFHTNWAFITVALNGLAGLWGLLWVRNHLPPPVLFWPFVIAGYAAVAVQIGIGLSLTGGSVPEPARLHVFYGFVLLIAAVLSLAFRSDRPRSNVLRLSAISLFIAVVGGARTIPTGFDVPGLG